MAESILGRLFSINGCTAVVTGGTRGIGEQIAIALAEAGADIILIQVCETGICEKLIELKLNKQLISGIESRTKPKRR
jgi:2-deoxy-D-gluconate 3-dehydrogenase